MLLPIERVWNSVEAIREPAIQLEEKSQPIPAEEGSTIKIPVPALPHPDTIHSVCLVMIVILMFLLLLEVKQMVRLLKLR